MKIGAKRHKWPLYMNKWGSNQTHRGKNLSIFEGNFFWGGDGKKSWEGGVDTWGLGVKQVRGSYIDAQSKCM